jgi:hypothetical protein
MVMNIRMVMNIHTDMIIIIILVVTKKKKKKRSKCSEKKSDEKCCQIENKCCQIENKCCQVDQCCNEEIVIKTMENCTGNNVTIRTCGNTNEVICLDVSCSENKCTEVIPVCNPEKPIDSICDQTGTINLQTRTTLINQPCNSENCNSKCFWSIKTYASDNLGLIAIDSNNDIIVASQSSNGLLAFIEKYDPQGKLIWYSFISSTNNVTITGLTTDPSNNILIVGTYSAPINIYNCNQLTNTVSITGNSNVFVMRYSSNGIFINSNQISSVENVSSYNIVSDFNSNYYVAGNFTYNLTAFNSNSNIGTTISSTLSSIFLVKFDTNGNVQWISQIQNTSPNLQANSSIGLAFSTDGTIVIAGSYTSQTLTIYNSNNQLSNVSLTNSYGYNNSFVAKYNLSGQVIWTANISGNSSITSIIVDSNYSIIVFGQYTNCIQIFGSATLSSYFTLQYNQGTNTSNTFLIKYNSFGTPLWTSSTNGSESGTSSIAIDRKNNIYSIVSFQTSAVLFSSNNTYTLENILSSQTSIIIKYNPDGIFLSNISKCGATGSYFGIVLDSNDNIIFEGNYNSTNFQVNSNIIKYYQYGQELFLEKPTCETNKTLILNQYCGINTLINLNQPSINCFIPSAILLTQQSTIVLLWTNCNWNIINNYNGIIIENNENTLV